jgi:hypothetical protein
MTIGTEQRKEFQANSSKVQYFEKKKEGEKIS